MTREQRKLFANLAGFFIGDGTVFVEWKQPHQVALAFYQVDLETMQIVEQLLGKASHLQDHRNAKTCHCLRYSGRKVFGVLRVLLPYMWECEKKRKATLLLEHADLWLRGAYHASDILAARLQVAKSVNNPYKGKHRAKPDAIHTSGTCDGHTPPP